MSEKVTESINRAVEMMTEAMEENNRLLAVYRSMNEVGRHKAMALIEDLAKIPEYQEKEQNIQYAPDETDDDPFADPK